ncbi:hypothetical protein PP756_gp49 [Pseudomonas phage VB_PaeP_VL1]|uniref:Uncharacterized protein n=1 Tax=Pseudomonas phage VB_PaeP_VL1 TaxID=2894395 RepID=A0AAE8Z0D0_9CAUD|nr:hypothetical protein PP756_gp49 [Pseudomonas phage VB_PaeP_VL1]UGV19845.1 hypothetical protein vBPaePVL1_49 [Pseudomonas phage VB_PaeP_VL1]WJZ48977.1 hypothetical protein [Pseudomonas phage PA15]WRN92326.1 hypothetical protein [Pseudomonas phage vB_Pae_HMKU_23]
MNYYLLYLALGAAWFFVAIGHIFRVPAKETFQRYFTPPIVISLSFFSTFMFYVFLWPLALLIDIWRRMTKKSTT